MAAATAAIVGGTILSAGIAANASKRAGRAQERASEATVAEQRRQFDMTRQDLLPSLEAGNLAREQQQALLGLSGVEAQQAAFAGLQESPGQQFLRERGQRNLLRNAAAIGGLGGGNVRSELVQQGVGFAQQDLQNQFGRLGQLAGQGQQAATNIGQFGAQSATNIGNALQAGGRARASGILGQNQAIQSGISGVFTGLGQAGAFGGSTPPPTGQFGGVT